MTHKVVTDEFGYLISSEYLKNSPNIPSPKRRIPARIHKKTTAQKPTLSSKPDDDWTFLTKSRLSECPICGGRIRGDRLPKHLKKVHHKFFDTNIEIDQKQPLVQPSSPSRLTANDSSVTSAPSKLQKGDLEEIQTAQKQIVGYTSAGKPLVKCHLCSSTLRQDRLIGHYVKQHFGTAKDDSQPVLPISTVQTSLPSQASSLQKCSVCGFKLRPNTLKKHMQECHPQPKSKKKRSKNRASNSQHRVKRGKNESLEQASSERRYCGKYLGYMRRENGRFGSLPLYDDYDDESSPD